MRTTTVKTFLPLTPTEAWDKLVAPEFPPLFSSLPETYTSRWVGNFLLNHTRNGGYSVNIARVLNRPHRIEIAARSGRTWFCLFDADPEGTVCTAWIEGNFDVPPPSGFRNESENWLDFYNAYLQRWSEILSSIGWMLTGTIPEELRWTLD